MIAFPETTNFYGPMPKELFIKHLNGYPDLKKTFMDEIESIITRAKLTPATLMLAAGENVAEIAVVEIMLRRQAISLLLLTLLARETAAATVFIARYEEWGQIWCRQQDDPNQLAGQENFGHFHQTSWMPYEQLELTVIGKNLDQVYLNMARQVAGLPPLAENEAPENNSEQPRSETPISTDFAADRHPQDGLDGARGQKELEAMLKSLASEIDGETHFKQQVLLIEELEKAKKELEKMKIPVVSQDQLEELVFLEPSQYSVQRMRAHFQVVMPDQNGQKKNSL